MLALVACAALLLGLDPPSSAPADPPRDYAEARTRADRTPDGQVRLALWCEAHGLPAERLKHLAMAVMADPNHPAARGLLGLVARGGRWMRPEAVAEQVKADPAAAATLAEYDGRRQRAAYKADAQYELGLWCEGHGLKDQARAHLTAAIRLDPSREAAWKRLGYRKHDGRWATDAQLAAEKAEAEAQRAADKKWKPLLEKWKGMLAQPSRRDEATASLSGVTDPRAVPSIGRVFGTAEAELPRAARLLGQVDSQNSSKALAFLAVFPKSAEVRRAAIETLRRRDAREYADLLIALIRDPIKYQVRPSAGPGSPGVLFVEGKKSNLRRFYTSTSAYRPGDTVGFDRYGQPVLRHVVSNISGYQGVPPRPQSQIMGHTYGYSDLSGSPGTLATDGSMIVTVGSGLSTWGSPIGQASHPALAGGQSATTPEIRRLLGDSPAASRLLDGVRASTTGNFPGHLTTSGVGPARFPIGTSLDFARSVVAEIPLGQALAESQKSDYVSRQQLKADVEAIEATNRATNDLNDRAVLALNGATGLGLPAERATWDRWWVDQLGYAFITGQTATNPTVDEVVPSGYQPDLTPSNVITQTAMRNRISCFGAGTPVRTIDGLRPIEALEVGDQVLTQDVGTGALAYRPVLVVHHNPPSPTYRVGLGGEAIVSSHFHRFWVAGRGWVMARDLKPGDPIRTLGGVEGVESIEPAKVQPVFNLDVAEDADFFAGRAGALVHDNTLPDPRLAPFDALPASKAVAAPAR